MLLCYGGVGNGKSHLCEATAIELYKRGLFVRVMTMSNMMITLKSHMNKKTPPGYDWLLSSYCLAERLILDDVGMGGSGSSWEWGQLEDIMNRATRWCDEYFGHERPWRKVKKKGTPEFGPIRNEQK